MSLRWLFCVLCLSLTGCSRERFEQFAEATRDRVHINGAEAKSAAANEEFTDTDFAISRRASAPTPKKTPEGDMEKPLSNSPFATSAEPESGLSEAPQEK